MQENQLLNLIGTFGLGFGIAIAIAALFVTHYLPGYLSEKGKNLATREDVEAITDKVEAIRHQYSELLEQLKARHQLRMAAVERRLQAHQEAFTVWRPLVNGPNEHLSNAIAACQTWWTQNCIYLDPGVRRAFLDAYMQTSLRIQLMQAGANATQIMECWNKTMAFSDILFKAIELPALSVAEREAMKPEDLTRIGKAQ